MDGISISVPRVAFINEYRAEIIIILLKYYKLSNCNIVALIASIGLASL